jgi:S1-C subfamily serine protease
MSDDWYVRKGHKTLGPLTEVEVRHVFDTGRITPETLVRQGLTAPWMPAGPAFADGPGPRAPSRTRNRPRIVIAATAGLAIVAVGLWIAFWGGHRAVPPVAAPEPAEIADNSSADDPAKPLVETQTPPTATTIPAVQPRAAPAASAAKPHQALMAERPAAPPPAQAAQQPAPLTASDSTASAAKTTVTPVPSPANPLHAEAVAKSVPPKPVGSPSKPAVVAPKPKPAVVKIAPVIPNPPATTADLRALESTAMSASTAKEALALYQFFGATRPISPAAEQFFKANLQAWEVRAGQGLVRVGEHWVAAAYAAKARQISVQLILEAVEMIKALSFDEAHRRLDLASRYDQNSIAADFTAGLLSSISPAKVRSPLTAAKHFEMLLRRTPGYVPALNNLAIAEVRLEQYAEAVQHLREATDRWPVPEEVTQNVARFISEAQLDRIHPTQPVLTEATELYARVARSKERAAAAERPKHGWRYLPLVLPKGEREWLSRLESPAAESRTVVLGTGLVVEPQYVLTCRHVIDDPTLGLAEKIELVDPTDSNHERRLPATCVAVDEADDLCLLKCDGLKVPPIALAETLPARGSEVLLLDLLLEGRSGAEFKTMPGLVTALPGQVAHLGGPKWLDFSRQLWCDAAVGHRANGGALCDDHGNVLAISSTLYTAATDASAKEPATTTYGGGVPASSARAFVRSSLPAFGHSQLGGPALDWSKVSGKVRPSLVQVATGYRKVVMTIPGKTDASGLNYGSKASADDIYDDHCCTVCNGRARILCRAPGCPFARLHDERLANDPSVTNAPKPSARHTCPSCLGSGYVRCPHCSIGIDPLLR